MQLAIWLIFVTEHVHQIVVDVSTEYHCRSKCMEAAMNRYAHNRVMYNIL